MLLKEFLPTTTEKFGDGFNRFITGPASSVLIISNRGFVRVYSNGYFKLGFLFVLSDSFKIRAKAFCESLHEEMIGP